jgi:predicted nucleic acid-binding protein
LILIDTGPIVALFDRDDRYHQLCLDILEKIHEPLIATWPVLTECFCLLGFSGGAQEDLWTFLRRGGIEVFQLDKSHFSKCCELMKQFRNLPMDLADATIVAAAEELGTAKIFTLDHRYFSVYRFRKTRKFQLLPTKL